MNANIARETKFRVKRTLHRFALIKAWTSASIGVLFMIAAPFLVGQLEASGAPMARAIGIALFSIGICCMLLAFFERREASFLRKHLDEPGEAGWAPPLFDASPVATRSHGALKKRPLQTA